VPLRSVAPERWFASDNAAGAAPEVLAALLEANSGHALAYGNDPWTKRAQESFCRLFDRDVVTQFAYGGTGANVFALGCLLRPAEAVVCSRVAHVTYDETGAAERIIGTKLLEVETVDGKVTPRGLSSVAHLLGSEHHVQPAVLTITQATEMGTLYSTDEIHTLCDLAHEMGLLVHMDGARIANAAAALGGSSTGLRAMTFDAGVDVLTFGGTKCGAVFGEAVIFSRPELAVRSKYVRKQTTQLHSKMRFIAAQYEALLDSNLFIDLGRRANEAARTLHDAVSDIESLRLTSPPQVNSIFPRLEDPAKTQLQDWSFFWDWDVAASQVRWMTAWDTSPADVARFAEGVREALR
jgi:threonine aldolase